MSNVLTSVAPVLYSEAVSVPRELIGGLMAVRRDFNDQGVAKGDTVKVSVAPALSSSDVTASQSFSAGSDRTLTARSLTLDNFKEVSWNLTAEEERSLENSDVARDILAQTVQQGFRTLANLIEADVMATAYVASTRATGTAGTTPFASSLADIANIVKILDDNGAGIDRHLVINTSAKAALMSLTQLTNVNQAGTARLLREGALDDLGGLMIHASAQVQSHTKGTATGALVNSGGGLAVGATSIPFDTATAGATGIKAGDVITFAADTANKYVVKTGVVGASGTLEIQSPGLLVAIPDNNAITVGNSYAANLAFNRDAVVAVARPALQPQGAIAEQSIVTDPSTGLSALLLRVPGNAMASWYMRVVYDSFVPNPYAVATLLG